MSASSPPRSEISGPIRTRAASAPISTSASRCFRRTSRRCESAALPGFKLRRITDWMAEHLAEEFCLARLAELAGMSEFHFNRLFKRATGVPPSQYLIRLRLEAAAGFLPVLSHV